METYMPTESDSYMPKRHRWTRNEFYKIIEAGCFEPNAHLELIEGDIVEKELPMNSPHATGVRRGLNVMRNIFTTGYIVDVQLPLYLSDINEPLPDIAVVAGLVEDFEEEHPTTAALILEVSDTTLREDRTTKVSLYARGGIPDYWILNLNDRVLEVYREPNGALYESIRFYHEGEDAAPLAAPDRPIAVSDLLPRQRTDESK